jgi:crotonobetainyl-CoA:carnitine CoA-transferase CaiB-like acyl-CoA transferase
VLLEPDFALDPRCQTNAARVVNRSFVDGRVAQLFASLSSADVIARLARAQTAYGNINSVQDLIEHPQLRTRSMPVGEQSIEVAALPWITEWDPSSYRPAPAVNQHGEAIRAEFSQP